MGQKKPRKRKKVKPPPPKKRFRWTRKTCLVYVPLTVLSFGTILGAILIHVLNHPDIYHVTVFTGIVLLGIYLFYVKWKEQ